MSKEYEQHVRVAYHESNDAVRVTLPKKIKFCATIVHAYFRDMRTLVISADKSKQSQFMSGRMTKTQTPNCFEYLFHPCGHIGLGEHFGITPVESYQIEEGNLVITFPSMSNRRRARIRHAKKSATSKVNASQPSGTVNINVYENDLEFVVPQAELFELVMTWQAKGYNAS